MHFRKPERAPVKIDWFVRTLNLQYYLRECLARLSNLLPEGFGKTKFEICEAAKSLVTKMLTATGSRDKLKDHERQ